MARTNLNEEDRKVQVGVMVEPSLREQVETLARERQWTISKAAAFLLKRGAEAEGLASSNIQAKAA